MERYNDLSIALNKIPVEYSGEKLLLVLFLLLCNFLLSIFISFLFLFVINEMRVQVKISKRLRHTLI